MERNNDLPYLFNIGNEEPLGLSQMELDFIIDEGRKVNDPQPEIAEDLVAESDDYTITLATRDDSDEFLYRGEPISVEELAPVVSRGLSVIIRAALERLEQGSAEV